MAARGAHADGSTRADGHNRGLLLDLLATGDREGVDAAMEVWIELNIAAGMAGGGR